MRKQVLFIQGGGNGGYEADAKLVASLQKALGKDYELNYPRMQTDEAAPDFGWLKQIGKEIGKLKDDVILVAHSFGASLLLKYLSENKVSKKIAGIFLMSVPFWSGKEDWVQGLKLQEDFAGSLPKNSRIFFYHCRDDEEVSFDHLASYRHKLPVATFREIESGGHQLSNNLNLVAKDIKDL
jgi:predicted alpha/beta hydrolase family esterase